MTKFKKTTIGDSDKKNEKEGQTVLVSSSDTYFDDCPICQAMKKAEEEGRNLSEKELVEAFAEANEKQKQGRN